MWNFKKHILRETESSGGYLELGSERNEEILVKGYKRLVIRLTGVVIIVNNTVPYAECCLESKS